MSSASLAIPVSVSSINVIEGFVSLPEFAKNSPAYTECHLTLDVPRVEPKLLAETIFAVEVIVSTTVKASSMNTLLLNSVTPSNNTAAL